MILKARWLGLPMLVLALGTAAARGEPQPEPARDVIRRLSGTRWALELRPMFGQPSETPIIDTLSFAGEEMASELFGAGGFPSSAFTLTIGDDGVPVWEASQLNPQQGIILWRGELHEQTMNGTVSKCPLEGPIEDFTFVGREAAQAPAPEPSAAVQPETEFRPDPQPQPEPEPETPSSS